MKEKDARFRNLVAQYDQTGAYVGNSDIYQISGTISSIGAKIKAALFQALNSIPNTTNTNLLNTAACAVFIGGDTFPLIVFGVWSYFNSTAAYLSYIYNPNNGTWMPFTYNPPTNDQLVVVAMSPLATVNSSPDGNRFNQTVLTYGMQPIHVGATLTPQFFALQEGVPNVNSLSNQAGVAFPEEEVLFGRDVTIDALYMALWAKVSENTFVDFYINGVLYATLELTSAVYNTLNGNPIENQLFALPAYGAGADTGHAPQLTYKIRSLTDTGTAFVRFSKIMILASIAPSQRPA